MVRDAVDPVAVGVVVLDEAAAADVEYLDLAVARAARHARAVRAEAARVDAGDVVAEGVDEVLLLDVEQPHRVVVAAGADETLVGAEARAAHPVGVACVAGCELGFREERENLYRFVVAPR